MEHLNAEIAAKLREMADLLDAQNAVSFRARAYRRGAETLESLKLPIDELYEKEGEAGLIALPGIGRGIASAIRELLTTSRWAQLERLSGTLEPERLFQTIPGMGPELARRIHDELHVDTLEDLEAAAHDGRLAQISGIGERRVSAIRSILGERLGHKRVRPLSHSEEPPISDILSVDREYLESAERGALPLIAPSRFNPEGKRWLPVLHSARGPWHYTALFSNTAKAHELGKTGDWVVIYFHMENEPEAQCTVVTQAYGVLAGRRVVRGREGDCMAHYAARADGA